MREHVTVDLEERERSDFNTICFPPVGLTKQCFADECDIGNIMARFDKTGLIEHVNKFQGDYGDFTGAQEYQESLNQVMAAEDMFMSLPAKVRAKFENDPGQFLDFVGNPDNLSEMVDLGLANPVSAPVEAVVEPTDLGS